MYLTGDTHCDIDIGKLQFWHEAKKGDILIILGDFGAVFHPEETQREVNTLPWYETRPYEVAFIDGNHDNYNRLKDYPEENWNGGRVRRINSNVVYLQRGQIYLIEDKKVLTIGGASSIDKEQRIKDISWWATELLNKEEEDFVLANLDQHEWKVDLVLTHTIPASLMKYITLPEQHCYIGREPDSVEKFLDHIYKNLEFKAWYCGHWHIDQPIEFDNRFTLLNNRIARA